MIGLGSQKNIGAKGTQAPADIQNDGDTKGKVSTKCWLLSAVVSIILVAAIVGGILGTVYIMQQQSREVFSESLEFLLDNHEQETEKVNIDESKNIVEVELEKQKAHLVLDYGKRILSGKVITEDGVEQCFVQPLPDNGMEAGRFKNMDKMDAQTKELTLEIQLMQEEITDHTFLPAVAEKLCSGYDLYWSSVKITDSDTSEFADVNSRVKRGKIWNWIKDKVKKIGDIKIKIKINVEVSIN